MKVYEAIEGVHVPIMAPPIRHGDAVSVRTIDRLIDAAESYRIERISVGDHQGNRLEGYTALGYMASRTRRVELGPYVTNVVSRDVGTHAAALASLDALSGGRAYMVLGRGDGALRNLGLDPTTIAETKDAVVTLDELLGGERSSYRGREIRLNWPVRTRSRIRLYVATGGTRMISAVAGVVDGLYLASGLVEHDIRETLATVEAAAARSERESDLDIWWVTRFGIGETTAAGIAAVGESLSSIANHSLRGTDLEEKGIPRELRDPLQQYHDRYDWSRKNAVGPGPSNVDLMIELGLQDYLLERYAVAGSPDDVVKRLRDLASRGVRKVVLNVHSEAELELLGREVLPFVRPSPASSDQSEVER